MATYFLDRLQPSWNVEGRNGMTFGAAAGAIVGTFVLRQYLTYYLKDVSTKGTSLSFKLSPIWSGPFLYVLCVAIGVLLKLDAIALISII